MQKLEDWLVQKKTCPDLRKLLLHMINRWRAGLMVYNHVPCEFEWCKTMFTVQKDIGCRQLMGGCLALDWSRAQDAYFKWIDMKKMEKHCNVSLIKKL